MPGRPDRWFSPRRWEDRGSGGTPRETEVSQSATPDSSASLHLRGTASATERRKARGRSATSGQTAPPPLHDGWNSASPLAADEALRRRHWHRLRTALDY